MTELADDDVERVRVERQFFRVSFVPLDLDGRDARVLARFDQKFRREIEDSIAHVVEVAPEVGLVITEGNYLLLPDPPWDAVRPLLDEAWFVHLDDDERRRRMVLRHESHGHSPADARARTFGFTHEVEYLRAHGLARGGSLGNAIVMDESKVLNSYGLRYDDEFVKHKALDAIGDLYLIGHQILGSYIAHKSGHALNNQLIRAVLEHPQLLQVLAALQRGARQARVGLDETGRERVQPEVVQHRAVGTQQDGRGDANDPGVQRPAGGCSPA